MSGKLYVLVNGSHVVYTQFVKSAGTQAAECRIPTARDVESVWKPRISGDELLAAARSARELAVSVHEHWGEFDADTREMFRALAHELTKADSGPRVLFQSWRDRLYLAWMVFRGRLEPVIEFLLAVEVLVDAVEDAIERENPEYESDIVDALETSMKDADEPGMTVDEFEQWSKDAVDSTLKEL